MCNLCRYSWICQLCFWFSIKSVNIIQLHLSYAFRIINPANMVVYLLMTPLMILSIISIETVNKSNLQKSCRKNIKYLDNLCTLKLWLCTWFITKTIFFYACMLQVQSQKSGSFSAGDQNPIALPPRVSWDNVIHSYKVL